MKSLLVIRHAKSDQDSSMADIDRPLNERGKKDASEMAKALVEKVTIDAFISSPANRAKTTASYFCKAYKRKEDEIILKQELYHAITPVYYDVIRNIDGQFQTVAVFAHNPGITDFVNTLTSTRIDNMPTCAVFAINADCDEWKNFKAAEKIFSFFKYPKLLSNQK